ncbi:MAG TPA: sigma-54 dependent transcriptional regulator [Candidatus Methylomirabilis sp.]|nr:sigma-54 dependent transcriptional regulator [Candidatus Methylomirabilis sp.]
MAGSDPPSFHGMIGRSAAMQALFGLIRDFAPYDISVLIQGETGTGKELVANAIHQLSVRSGFRFGPVNCGVLRGELLLSELFGHERGAFTGAHARKHGLLAVADGGTVFLDEVGDLPPDAQVALLRFLQSGEIRPVGSNETRRVDVRIIAATHRDLDAAVESGTFREDLYHRLHKVVLRVPPLRARIEDLPLLVQHFLAQFNERHRLSVQGVAPEALRLLERHPWRGNVRQLGDVLEPAAIRAKREWITAKHLDLPVRPGADAHGATAGVTGQAPTATRARLGWLQREALRIAGERREVRRQDLVAQCRVSRDLARRALLGLARRRLLRRVGLGRATRYVPLSLSLWLTLMSDVAEWVGVMV